MSDKKMIRYGVIGLGGIARKTEKKNPMGSGKDLIGNYFPVA